MIINFDIAGEIAKLERRLSVLDEERKQVVDRLAKLKKFAGTPSPLPAQAGLSSAHVTMNSSTAAEIALFRSLFRGRGDVFRKRKSSSSIMSMPTNRSWPRSRGNARRDIAPSAIRFLIGRAWTASCFKAKKTPKAPRYRLPTTTSCRLFWWDISAKDYAILWEEVVPLFC